jgi:hypothetical protein
VQVFYYHDASRGGGPTMKTLMAQLHLYL